VVLLVAWLVMRYTVVRLPLKPFFMFTGSFMYLMAFVFAGKGGWNWWKASCSSQR
jgi:high-affinity iron transporter